MPDEPLTVSPRSRCREEGTMSPRNRPPVYYSWMKPDVSGLRNATTTAELKAEMAQLLDVQGSTPARCSSPSTSPPG